MNRWSVAAASPARDLQIPSSGQTICTAEHIQWFPVILCTNAGQTHEGPNQILKQTSQESRQPSSQTLRDCVSSAQEECLCFECQLDRGWTRTSGPTNSCSITPVLQYDTVRITAHLKNIVIKSSVVECHVWVVPENEEANFTRIRPPLILLSLVHAVAPLTGLLLVATQLAVLLRCACPARALLTCHLCVADAHCRCPSLCVVLAIGLRGRHAHSTSHNCFQKRAGSSSSRRRLKLKQKPVFELFNLLTEWEEKTARDCHLHTWNNMRRKRQME